MTAADPRSLAAKTLADLERAWNTSDGTSFGAAFTQDSDFVDIRGGHHRGREAVGAGHQSLFDSYYAGSVIRYRLEAARAVAPGCVVAVAGATLKTASGPAAGVHHARLTAVLTQGAGGWSIAAFHNAPVQANA